MNEQKENVSVSFLAKDLGLSRSRFYELVNAGVFPQPIYSIQTRRPFYDRVLQDLCREVRRKNCGINGKPILFYSSRRPPTASKRTKQPKSNYSDLIDQLADLGLTISTDQVESAIKSCFPQGTADVQPAELIRALFVYLKRQN